VSGNEMTLQWRSPRVRGRSQEFSKPPIGLVLTVAAGAEFAVLRERETCSRFMTRLVRGRTHIRNL